MAQEFRDRFVDRERVALGVHGKVVLPTAVPLYENNRPLGVDLGLTGQFLAHQRIQVHADLGLVHSVGLGNGPTQPRIGATITAGAEFRPAWRFTIVTDLHAGFGYTAPLDVLAAALALRASDGKRFGFELGATVPLLGRERAAARIDLAWTVRFGAVTEAPPDPRPGKKASAAGE